MTGHQHGQRGRRPGQGGKGPRQRSKAAPSQRSRTADPARDVAFEVLRAVREDDAYANLVLPVLLRRRGLDARDAGLATELTYGTLRGQGLYDAVVARCTDRPLAQIDPAVLDALRIGAHQLLATRVPAHAAVSQTVGLVRDRIGSGPGGFANAVLRRIAERTPEEWLEVAVPPREDDLVAHLSVRYSHPAWVVRSLRESLVAHGRPVEEIDELLAADNLSPQVTLLARPGLADVAELVAAADGAAPGRWSPYAVVLGGGDPGGLTAVHQRRARVQDEGSQLVALALAGLDLGDGGRGAGPERWLDLCAGPGGKAALLAARAAQEGAALVAVEISEHRAELVRGAVGPDVDVRTADGRELGEAEPGAYDRVLVDAPCTGLGALRRRPEARWRRQPSDLATLGPLQRQLLDSALAAVRPGGVVAYATCSPHPAETVAAVQDALRRHPGLEQLDAPAAVRAVSVEGEVPDLGDGPTAQLWPHRHGTDAMFLALLRRPAG